LRTRPGDSLGEPTGGEARPDELAYVADGPRIRDERRWWRIRQPWSAFGWAPVRAAKGADVLQAFEPACAPVDALTADDLTRLAGRGSLVCYGDASLTFDAQVTCYSAAVDGGAGGVPWRSSGHICHTDTGADTGIGLNGPAITAVVTGGIGGTSLTAEFRLTGHFDDPLAVRCWNVPVGIGLSTPGRPDPAAVIDCRSMFVVTEAIRLD
jgi:hypothetical protein